MSAPKISGRCQELFDSRRSLTYSNFETVTRLLSTAAASCLPTVPPFPLLSRPVSTRFCARSSRATAPFVTAACLFVVATSVNALGAQQADTFTRGVVVTGDWLQANALPLDRDALHSVDGGVSFRRTSWAADLGWLRVARSLSTVQGGTLSFGLLLPWNHVLFIPTIGGLVGRAQRSVDSTGYDWVDPQTGTKGHTPRYSYSSATSIGGSVGLAIEVPVYGALAFRGVVSQWFFSGSPLAGDRARTLLGAGLSLRIAGGR